MDPTVSASPELGLRKPFYPVFQTVLSRNQTTEPSPQPHLFRQRLTPTHTDVLSYCAVLTLLMLIGEDTMPRQQDKGRRVMESHTATHPHADATPHQFSDYQKGDQVVDGSVAYRTEIH